MARRDALPSHEYVKDRRWWRGQSELVGDPTDEGWMIMSGSMQPTVVLVHGAFADASGFGGVIRGLTTSGYEVAAPPNPLRSLSFHAHAVGAYVRAISWPRVLAGHSYCRPGV